MDTVYISLGDTCQPARAISENGLRHRAFPFDWITGSGDAVVACLTSDFNGFHTTLRFSSPHPEIGQNTVLTDALGFSFHHDYPTVENNTLPGEDGTRETTIVSDWANSYAHVYAKYQRRIQRFRSVMQGPSPVVFVCHRPIADCVRIRDAIKMVYGKKILIITNSQEHIAVAGIVPYIHNGDDFNDFKRALADVRRLLYNI